MTALRQVEPETGEITTSDFGRLAAALAKAQASFPPVTRSKTVTVTTKTGGSYKFSYAPLDAILDAVRKPLSDNGLALAQLLDNGSLVTMLLHESGAVLEGRTALPQTGDVQALGSAITYLRRYAIQALLGIAAEEDDDGNAAKDAKPAKPTTMPTSARAPSDAPIPKSAPFTPLAGPEVPVDGEPERHLSPKAGTVQCESKSPFGTEDNPVQCRREMGHEGAHRTRTESWT